MKVTYNGKVTMLQHEIGDYIEIEAKTISEIDKKAFPEANIVIWTDWTYFYCKSVPELAPGKYYAKIVSNQRLAVEI